MSIYFLLFEAIVLVALINFLTRFDFWFYIIGQHMPKKYLVNNPRLLRLYIIRSKKVKATKSAFILYLITLACCVVIAMLALCQLCLHCITPSLVQIIERIFKYTILFSYILAMIVDWIIYDSVKRKEKQSENK